MHRRSLALALVLVLLPVLLVTACVNVKVEPPKTGAAATEGEPAAAAPFKAGDTVAAPWGGAQYLGTVKTVKDGTADVLYADDQQVREIAFGELKLVEKKTWNAGDKVLAVWSSGKFYPGTVQSAKGDVYTVKWDDGSTPSDVDAGKIMAQ